jgi:hypothetical protein
MATIYLDPNQVPAMLRGAYQGKKFQAVVCESTTIPADAGLWDGGSRETFRVVELATGRAINPPGINQASAPWDKRESVTVDLQNGYAVVRHSMFCGKDMGLTFYVHPDNAQKLLPAPQADDMTAHEKSVLEATCGLKSSYQGRDRYDLSQRGDYNIAKRAYDYAMTREEWNAAKESLIRRGYLNKTGAVTVSGRNACGSKY